MGEAISQDSIRKGIVFFLKKTTNFCTATIFDIHLVKKGKEQNNHKAEQNSLRAQMVISNSSRQSKAASERVSERRKGQEALLGLNVAGPQTEAKPTRAVSGVMAPYHHLTPPQSVAIKQK